jgi:hypothetical protein
MKNESAAILSESYSNFYQEQCKNCKQLKIEQDNNMVKYHCIVKEGDSFCDQVQRVINAIMAVENIKDMDEYIKRIKLCKR